MNSLANQLFLLVVNADLPLVDTVPALPLNLHGLLLYDLFVLFFVLRTGVQTGHQVPHVQLSRDQPRFTCELNDGTEQLVIRLVAGIDEASKDLRVVSGELVDGGH